MHLGSVRKTHLGRCLPRKTSFQARVGSYAVVTMLGYHGSFPFTSFKMYMLQFFFSQVRRQVTHSS